MNVKQGDLVKVDGVGSVVETSWGQGKHKVFKLKDGRQVLDLDKLVAAGKATIETPAPAPVEDKPKRNWSV